MVSTLTTRAVTGGVLTVVIATVLYLLWKKKAKNSAEDGGVGQDGEGDNSGDSKDKGRGDGAGDGPPPDRVEQLQRSLSSSMTQSFEMVNREDIDNGEDKGGGQARDGQEGSKIGHTAGKDTITEGQRQSVRNKECKPSSEGEERKSAKANTKTQGGVNQSSSGSSRSDRGRKTVSHHNENEKTEKDPNLGKSSKSSGLTEVSEELQASVAKVLNVSSLNSSGQEQEPNQTSDTDRSRNEDENHLSEEGQQVDRKENILQAVQSRDKISKAAGSKLTENVNTHVNGCTNTSEVEQKNRTDQQKLAWQNQFSQEEIFTAILVSQNSPGVVSSQNAEVLVALLSHPDPTMKMSAITGINKCSAFTRNQNLLREHGCLPVLSDLLKEQKMALKSANQKFVSNLALAVNNLSANEQNHKELKDCVPSLIDIALEDETGDSLCLSSLQALTNLSVMPDHHGHYTRVIQKLYDFVDTGQPSIRLQATRVLVNLSCNPDIVPHMLAAKAPSCALDLLRLGTDEAILLRWTTLLANILTTVKEHNLSSASLPTDDKAPSPEMMYTALYGTNNTGQIKSKVFLLCRHRNEDIKHQATRIYQTLNHK